jgi:hypothetical protein
VKQFLLFAGDDYYPCGGWSDLIGDHDTADDALSALMDLPIHTTSGQWAQIVDTVTGTVTEFHGRLAREWKHGDKGQPWTCTRHIADEDTDE